MQTDSPPIDKPRPWTQQECRDRYVRGTKISLKELAVESGNSYKTINNWSRFDEPRWSIQRKTFEAEVRSKSDNKILEKTSDLTSDLAVEHLNSYQSARKVADAYFQWQNQRIEEVKGVPERLEAELKSIRASNINFWLLSLERAINGERLAAGLEWENVPKAIAFLQKLGYVITDPSLPPATDAEAELEATPKGFTDEQAGDIRARILGIPQGTTSSTPLSGEVDIWHKEDSDSREVAPSRD
jgi:hypothetical protein